MPEDNDELSPEELLAQMAAGTDQAVAAAGEVARVCWALYAGLREQGFDSQEALALTLAWLTTTMSG